jgi:SAM-dependent methyltransferase
MNVLSSFFIGDLMIPRTVGISPQPGDLIHRFAEWVAESCDPGTRVLDIGAGRARWNYPEPIVGRMAHLVGIDPDAAIHRNGCVAERHQLTIQEFAGDHPQEFDVVFSVFVLEHVADPQSFVKGCARVLKPGGRFYGLTPNLYQYFGLTTWAASRLGVSNRMLGRLKGPDVMDDHFPTEYRLNTIPTITRQLEQAGFRSVEYRCCEQPRRFQWYLPRGLKWWAPAYARTVYSLKAPWLMGYLSFCATKQ